MAGEDHRSAPRPEQPRHSLPTNAIVTALQQIRRFFQCLFGQFCADRCLIEAAGLSYTTLLAIVPLMTVGFSVLAAFPVFEDVTHDIQDFIFRNFVPAFGELVEQHLQQFVQQAKRLTVLGIALLIGTALLLMSAIERALNDIWKVRHRRRAMSSFLVYWAVLSLGPMLIGTSLAITSYLVSLPLFAEPAAGGLKTQVLRVTPFLSATLGFALLYTVVPNRNVPLRYALAGALVASVVFELANRAFALFVTQFPTYQVVYGALAAIPVFLAWIYVSWVVILLGAELTHSLMTFRTGAGDGCSPTATPGLVEAYRVLGHLWDAQTEGRGLSNQGLLALEQQLTDAAADRLLSRLEAARLVQRTVTGEWMLARDLGKVKLADLVASQPNALPDGSGAWKERDARNLALAAAMDDAKRCLTAVMDVPLASLYENRQATAPSTVAGNPGERGQHPVNELAGSERAGENGP